MRCCATSKISETHLNLIKIVVVVVVKKKKKVRDSLFVVVDWLMKKREKKLPSVSASHLIKTTELQTEGWQQQTDNNYVIGDALGIGS